MVVGEHQALENVRIRINVVHVKLLASQDLITKFLEAERQGLAKKDNNDHFYYANKSHLWNDLFSEILQLNCLMKSTVKGVHDAELVDEQIKKETEASIQRFAAFFKKCGSRDIYDLSFNNDWFQKGALDPTHYKSENQKIEFMIGATINNVGFCERLVNKIISLINEIEALDKKIPDGNLFEITRGKTLARRSANVLRGIELEVMGALHEFKIAITQLFVAKGLAERFAEKEDIFKSEIEKRLGNSSKSTQLRKEYAQKLLKIKKQELQLL